MAKILVVDSDPALSFVLSHFLTTDKHTVESAGDGLDAKIRLENSVYELIIMDWNFPGEISGVDLLKDYRAAGGNSPVLLLSGRSAYEDKEFGLDSGADDYVCKPFHPRELSARVRALLRRPPQVVSRTLKVGNLELDSMSHKVYIDGTHLKLFPKEFTLLEFFMRHPNKVCSSQLLLEALWSIDRGATIESLRQLIARLRAKLESAGAVGLISTIYGVGYRLEGMGAQASTQNSDYSSPGN
jgi:DNA-binding response OmpR family regulator